MKPLVSFVTKIIKHHAFPTLVGCLLLLGILDQVARTYSLFWVLPGFDKVLHTIGGFMAALFSYIIISNWYPHLSAKKKFFAVVGFALFIGVCVEIGEVVLNHFLTHPLPFDPSDTIGDILFDILGGVLAWVYYLG